MAMETPPISKPKHKIKEKTNWIQK